MTAKKKCLCFGALVCVLILFLCWFCRGQPCQVTIERRPESDKALPEGCTVQTAEGEILIRDYWNPQDVYTTAYASAKLQGHTLVVRSSRTVANDEIYMTGSAVLLRVQLPEGVKGTELQKIVVHSKGQGWRQTTRVSFPPNS